MLKQVKLWFDSQQGQHSSPPPLHIIQTGSRALSACCPVSTEDSFHRNKVAGWKINHLSPSIAEVKNA
jgi:hypothetical protein